jgi:hypothetical protein
MMFNLRNASRSGALLLGCGAALSLLNCAADQTADAGNLTETAIASGETEVMRIALQEDTAVVVTVDCGVPEAVDLMGNQIEIDASSMGVERGPARAAFWQWAGIAPAGEHQVSVRNVSPTLANCKLSITEQGASEPSDDEATSPVCSSWSVSRSTIYDATHLSLGDTEHGEWDSLPASGNHWGTWAHWGKVYSAPVLRGYYLHNLEHGGALLSYGCASAEESDACAAAEASLIELANSFGERRVLVTPDPDQPEMFAVRSWRWAYSSDCLEENVALEFLRSNFRHGREDIDGDPPLPFDPTSSENVPCENLMAAPDSC